jgi:hypothetical protein
MKKGFFFIYKKSYIQKIFQLPLNNSYILDLVVSYTAEMNLSFFVSQNVPMFFSIYYTARYAA